MTSSSSGTSNGNRQVGTFVKNSESYRLKVIGKVKSKAVFHTTSPHSHTPESGSSRHPTLPQPSCHTRWAPNLRSSGTHDSVSQSKQTKSSGELCSISRGMRRWRAKCGIGHSCNCTTWTATLGQGGFPTDVWKRAEEEVSSDFLFVALSYRVRPIAERSTYSLSGIMTQFGLCRVSRDSGRRCFANTATETSTISQSAEHISLLLLIQYQFRLKALNGELSGVSKSSW
jgi:ribosomal protein S14